MNWNNENGLTLHYQWIITASEATKKYVRTI